MKKLFLSLLIGVSLVSCSDSDRNSGGNQVNVNGTTFNITDAKAVDNFNFYSETHAEYNFVMASAPITIDAIPGTYFGFETDNAKFALNLSIAALGNTFQNGVYQYDENMDFEQPNFNFFDGLTIYIDEDQDGFEDEVLFATEGTVTVSGTAPNYVLNFDVELSNGQNFNYTYNQGFDYVDNRN
jgi:hypothetical protein